MEAFKMVRLIIEFERKISLFNLSKLFEVEIKRRDENISKYN